MCIFSLCWWLYGVRVLKKTLFLGHCCLLKRKKKPSNRHNQAQKRSARLKPDLFSHQHIRCKMSDFYKCRYICLFLSSFLYQSVSLYLTLSLCLWLLTNYDKIEATDHSFNPPSLPHTNADVFVSNLSCTSCFL